MIDLRFIRLQDLLVPRDRLVMDTRCPFLLVVGAHECLGEHHMVTSFWKATDGLYTYQNCGFQHPCKLQLARLSTLITAMVTKYNLE